MGDMVTLGAPERPRIGATIAINRVVDVAAGSWWRAKEDVPELTRPERRLRGVYLPKDHPDYIATSRWGDENRIGTEEHFVDVPVRSACPGGRIHLVRSINLVDGDIHSVVLQNHPSEKDGSRTYLVDEFLAFFEMVTDAEAQAARDVEIAALHAEIGDIQARMIAGPPPEEPAGLVGHQASLPAPPSRALSDRLPPKPTIGAMIANAGQLERLRETAEQAVAIAKRQSDWIATHTRLIASTTQALVPFFQERASAALATTEKVTRYAQDLMKGVESLGVYTGKDVVVNTLLEGEPAPDDEPLRILKDTMFLDEEFLVHLQAEPDQAGADHRDFPDFVAALVEDPKLMARVFPHPKMIVLMRYRNTSKNYFPAGTMEAAIANAEYNKPNMAQFLLIRNGGQLTQVWSELTSQSIPALFPDKEMGDRPFRGIDGATITPENLTFAGAKGRFDDLARVYRNLAILLQGLADREVLDLGLPQPVAMLDPAYQERNILFWNPNERGTTIGSGRSRFEAFARAANGWLRSGSRVVVTERAIRGHAGYNGSTPEHDQPEALVSVGEHGDRAHEFVVRRTKKGHVVAVQASRTVYPRERGRGSYELRQTFDVPLNERHHGYDASNGLAWLCLDMVEAADIDHYLESRADRPSYMEHYHLILAVRDVLRREERVTGPIVDRLEEAFVHSGSSTPEGQRSRDVARHAIRLWRAANRGALPPAIGEPAHAAFYKTALGHMWTLAGNDQPIEEAEALARAEGREPLRLVMTGRDGFAIYATSVGDEIEDRLFEHVWVTRIACRRKGGRLMATSRRVLPMPAAQADEEVLREWDGAAAWTKRRVPDILHQNRYGERHGGGRYDHDAIRRAFDAVQSGDLEAWRTPTGDLSAHLERLKGLRRERTGRSSHVSEIDHVQPFAIIRTSGFVRKTIPGFEARYETRRVDAGFLALTLQDSPWRMAARLATDEAQRRMVEDAYVGYYSMQAGKRISFRETLGNPPTIAATRLADWAGDKGDPLKRESKWNSIPLDANWSEQVRKFDTERESSVPGGIHSPLLTDMLVWMSPTAPAILNEICAANGWGPKPFDVQEALR